MDEAMLDSKAAMVRFLNLMASEPDIACPSWWTAPKWDVIRRPGRCIRAGIVNSISMKKGWTSSSARPGWSKRYGAGGGGDGV